MSDDFDEPSCPKCGSSMSWEDCPNCDEEGFSHHDCGEDCCVCLHPENNVDCDWCDGKGGYWACVSSREWCEAQAKIRAEQKP